MTRNEMLKKMGLNEEEFKDLVGKFRQFHESLTPTQKAVVKASFPTIERAAKSFGPEVTGEELKAICGADATAVTFVSNVLQQQLNNGSPNDE